jgi:hypothetical protein
MTVAHDTTETALSLEISMLGEEACHLRLDGLVSSARAPFRKISVSESVKVPGWASWKTLLSVTAYHSIAGEVAQARDNFAKLARTWIRLADELERSPASLDEELDEAEDEKLTG